MAQGFTAEGTVSLTYPKKPRSGSRVQFTVRAGTIPCNSAGSAPTVSITGPAAGSVFNAPASVTVTADAQDSDGTVAQVTFYANGAPIGTVTSSPFATDWANVQAGAYSLTAVATDNEGLQTTSAAVPITVGARRALHYIHVDHLNTPRLIADGTRKTVWRWDQQEPFGNNSAGEDPNGDAIAFSYPQRFPGQYYDAETLLHYNYFRDYDPSLGIYKESDPVGLEAGPNTYAYGKGSPTKKSDFFGLDTCGSGFAEGLVPDNPFFFPISFCCRRHDQCYDDCLNTPTRAECDDRFCTCLSGRCHKYVWGVRNTCMGLAKSYCYSVANFGESAFRKAREACKACNK